MNVEVDKNDEDAKYIELKKPLAMRNDSCYGNGTIGVTWEQSDVHVPFNVYSMGKVVLTGANFSRDLDAKFAQNSKDANAKSTGLTWQYFAASDGYTRFYPALEWQRFDSIDRKQLSKNLLPLISTSAFLLVCLTRLLYKHTISA